MRGMFLALGGAALMVVAMTVAVAGPAFADPACLSGCLEKVIDLQACEGSASSGGQANPILIEDRGAVCVVPTGEPINPQPGP